MVRILVCDDIAPEGVKLLRDAGFEVDEKLKLPEDEIVKIIPGYDGAIVRSATKITKRILDAGAKLRIVGRAGIGVDNIDVEAATRRGVVVMNTPLGNVSSAAEHTFALLLASARPIAKAHAQMAKGVWDRKGLTGVELDGKTLGVVGLGKIGAEVVRYAKAFRMRVLAFDPFLSKERAEEMGVELVDFEAMLPQADFFTMHTPLTDKTRGMFNAAAFAKMKKTARIVNVARGGIVDEKALAEALAAKRIAGAGLDVFEKEPLPADSPLLKAEGITLTPHLGASTEEAQFKVSVDVAEQFAAYFRDGTVRNAVNIVAAADPKLTPYVDLAEKLGSLCMQLSGHHLRKIKVTCSGEIAGRDTRAVAVAALKGVLSTVSSDTVNLVNANVIAKDRGIVVVEQKSKEVRNYQTLVTVELSTESGERRVSGTMFDGNRPRIVQIDAYDVDLIPAPHLLIVTYPDRPGMMGTIGTVLGKHKINIAAMVIGRSAPGAQAMVFLTVDDPVRKEILDEIRGGMQVENLWWVRL